MNLLARFPAFVAALVGVASLSWLTAPPVQPILPGDPDVVLIVLSVLVLSISVRLVISAHTTRIAWGRTLMFNGLCCLAVTALTMIRQPVVANWIGGPIFVGLGVGAVVTATGLALLAGARRGGGTSQEVSAGEQVEEVAVSDFVPEETLLYRREGGANYRAFVQRVWANAEVSLEPLGASVDDRPCRIVSVARRPRGGCYINVIVDGVGYTLMAHAHHWSTGEGPVDIAAWGSKLLATEEAADNRRVAH